MSKLARTSSPIRSGPHSLHPTVIAAARLFSPLPSSRFAGAGGGGGELGRSLHGNSRESGYRYRNRSTSFCKIAGDRMGAERHHHVMDLTQHYLQHLRGEGRAHARGEERRVETKSVRGSEGRREGERWAGRISNDPSDGTGHTCLHSTGGRCDVGAQLSVQSDMTGDRPVIDRWGAVFIKEGSAWAPSPLAPPARWRTGGGLGARGREGLRGMTCNKPTVRDNGTDAEQLIGLQART
uniref:DUF1263 domain-containing protein n=1 Tax=Oryza meridionalis TaxID=40149 RepID=A0A0E0D7I9_9ORYZ